MLLNSLKPQAESITGEEHAAGFRAGSSTTEQSFNLTIIMEKEILHQQGLYHVFIDFRKAFDRVWHAALWITSWLYNFSPCVIKDIESLYDMTTSEVHFHGITGNWF